MSDWKDGIKKQGKDAFNALDLNTLWYERVINEARNKCPYCYATKEIWLEGFDEAAQTYFKSIRFQETCIEETNEDIEKGCAYFYS